MHCPACQNVNLVMSERSGIEIDYCPTCRGVWLDRGELDKIIERASAVTTTAQPTRSSPPPNAFDQRGNQPSHSHHEGNHNKKKKREGFFSDLFDFD